MKNKIKNKFVFEIIETIVGSFIMATAVSLFLLPNELSSGGFSGIGTILYYLFNIPVGLTIFLLNLPLFTVATYKIGKGFLIKSIIGTIFYSIFIDLLDVVEPITNDKILACIYGGMLTGVGTALILRGHASTGGSDLLSIIIKRYKNNFKTSSLIIIIDSIIILLNTIFFRKIEIGLYSAITIYLMGKIIDILFEGIYFTKLIFIVSEKNEEITKIINNKIQRGVTGLYGKGMFTNTKKMVLMCAVGRNDLVELKKQIKQIDSEAFLIVANSREVLGNWSRTGNGFPF